MRLPHSREICEEKKFPRLFLLHPSNTRVTWHFLGLQTSEGGVGERHTHPSGACRAPSTIPKTEGHLSDLHGTTQPTDTPLGTPKLPGAYLPSRHCSRPLPVYRPASSSGCYRVRGRDPTHPPPDSRAALRVTQRSCQPRKAKQMIAKPRFCV